jgi:hypothetical protein
VAVGARLPVFLNPLFATGADRLFFNLLKQRLFFKRPFVGFGECFAGAQEHVDKQPWHSQDGDHQSDDNLCERIAGARAHVTIRPDDHSEPERRQDHAAIDDDSCKQAATVAQITQIDHAAGSPSPISFSITVA